MQRYLILASAVLMALAPAAAAQSSGSTAQPSILGDNGVGLNAFAVPTTRSTGACTADASCASFPLTPLGATTRSLAPRLTPTIGTPPALSGNAIAAPPLGATLGPPGGLNPPSGALAGPGMGATPNQIGGLNRPRATAGNPATTGTPAAPNGGTPAMSSTSFQAQCANSLACSAFEGH